MALELHFHEPVVSLDRGSSGENVQHDDDSGSKGSSGKGPALGGLLALAVLVGIAYAVRKRRKKKKKTDAPEAEIRIDE